MSLFRQLRYEVFRAYGIWVSALPRDSAGGTVHIAYQFIF